MAHAVVMQVQLAGDPEQGLEILKSAVIPNAKAQTGFQRGVWMHTSELKGLGVIIFDTEENAAAARDVLKPPPEGPTLLTSELYEVAGEA